MIGVFQHLFNDKFRDNFHALRTWYMYENTFPELWLTRHHHVQSLKINKNKILNLAMPRKQNFKIFFLQVTRTSFINLNSAPADRNFSISFFVDFPRTIDITLSVFFMLIFKCNEAVMHSETQFRYIKISDPS